MSSPTLELSNNIIRAGAGAGKTTRLTQNIYNTTTGFFKLHQRWPKIVVTTFTRKATQELRERLIIKACEEGDDGFLDYVNSGSSIHISTIHGVLNLFLRNYGHLVGWDNSFQLMSSKEVSKISKTIVKSLDDSEAWNFWLENFSYKEILSLLSSYYEVKLSHADSRPADEELLTHLKEDYFNKYWQQTQELGKFILDNFEGEKWQVFTDVLFNITKDNLLEDLANLPSKPRKTKDTDPDADLHVSKTLKSFKEFQRKSGLSDKEILRSTEFYTKFKVIADEFIDKLLSHKKYLAKLEMRDLELLSLNILQQEPSLGATFSSEWDYWLIDEYQDTSPLQENLLSQLIGNSPSYVVGDPQQSIYLFRGARSEVFSRKENEWPDKKQVLVKNYRSKPEVLFFINDIFNGFEQSFLQMEASDRYGASQPDRIVANFYEGDEKYFVGREILKLLNQGVSSDKIAILARKNKSLTSMANFLNSQSIPTHVHASSGFYKRREILDIVFLVRFMANPFDNENLIGLLRTPSLSIKDSELINWSHDWDSYNISLWDHLKTKNVRVVDELKAVLQASQEVGLLEATLFFVKKWEVIDYSHFHDASGRRESNVWKFLTTWQDQEKLPGFNIFNFLNQSTVDLSQSEGGEESDAVAALEPNSVNLMTIHASKGLQFDHVFVLESGKGPNLSGGAKENQRIHFDEDSQSWSFAVPGVDSEKKERSLLDHKCIDQMKQRELEESDRLFYVALTRAIENIYISWDGNVHPHSWLGRSNYSIGMEKQEREGYCSLFENETINIQDFSWQSQKSETCEVKPLQAKEYLLGDKLKKISVTQYLEQLSHSSASKVNKDKESESPQNILSGAKTAHRGTEIHLLFEKAHYNKSLDVEEYLTNNFPQSDSQQLQKAFNWVKQLENPPMAQLINSGFVEWGFQWSTQQQILEGQIDLWGEVEGCVWIIDYKSGSSRYSQKALQQLDLYALPLYELGYKNLKKAVIFPLEEKYVVEDIAPFKDLEASYLMKDS